MRYILILGLIGLAGCQSVIGPFAPRSPMRVDDPCLTINEQESRSRDRYAIPEESPKVGPPSGFVIPGFSSRGDR